MLHNDIQKNMVDAYLKELAKGFKRLTGRKTLAEIIIVDGGSVLLKIFVSWLENTATNIICR